MFKFPLVDFIYRFHCTLLVVVSNMRVVFKNISYPSRAPGFTPYVSVLLDCICVCGMVVYKVEKLGVLMLLPPEGE